VAGPGLAADHSAIGDSSAVDAGAGGDGGDLDPLDTTAEPLRVPLRRVRRGHRLRLLFFLAVLVIVGLALGGWFGVRTRTVRGGSGGYTVSLEYAQIARRGVTVPWKLEVTAPDAFADELTVKVEDDYLSRLNIRQVRPDADQSTSEDGSVEWTFDKPAGGAFGFAIDAQIDSAAEPGYVDGIVTVMVGGQEVSTLEYRTWIWP
jgi:hypothetical protein